MIIRKITEQDRSEWARLRDALWPGSLNGHEKETEAYFATKATSPVVFVVEWEGQVVGFLELGLRPYAPGCSSSPVPFIEGWYVEPGVRKQGLGRALVAAAETHARSEGHSEIASDAELDNDDGLAAHKALGYSIIERIACFRKPLRES